MPQVQLTGAHPGSPQRWPPRTCPSPAPRRLHHLRLDRPAPGNCRDTADAILLTAAGGRQDLRDLAALAAGIQARFRPDAPDDDGPGPVFEDRQCGWRPPSAAPGSRPGTSPPNAPRWCRCGAGRAVRPRDAEDDRGHEQPPISSLLPPAKAPPWVCATAGGAVPERRLAGHVHVQERVRTRVVWLVDDGGNVSRRIRELAGAAFGRALGEQVTQGPGRWAWAGRPGLPVGPEPGAWRRTRWCGPVVPRGRRCHSSR